MHSIFSMSARRQSMTRPSASGSLSARPGTSWASVLTRWLPTTSAKWSNQNADMAVSTRPLWVMGSDMTTSNAEMRSDVTSNSRSSPAS